ncbi:MAG: hypothetical protein IPJ10_16365 [Flavobacteriales bacterium]|nr:hypothetical protein [Flavobacteriales bacterium]
MTLTTAAPITAATTDGTPSFCAGGSTTLTQRFRPMVLDHLPMLGMAQVDPQAPMPHRT